MTKKILCVLLLLSIALTSLIACNNANPPEGPETDSVAGDVDESNGGSENSKPSGGAPQPITNDFGGYDFRVLTRGNGAWGSDDITGTISGSRVSVATYKRNALLNQKYKFNIIEYKDKKWEDKANLLTSSGEDLYDMVSIRLNDIPSLGQEGALYNLNEVDGLNLDAEYYDQTTRHQGSFADYLFFLTGDMIYQDDAATGAIVFNCSIWTDSKLNEAYEGKTLYDLVREKEWTLENMSAMSKQATVDDGNGVWDTEDQYGYSYANVTILCMNIGLGNDLLKKDADDIFYMDRSTKLISDLESLFKFFNNGTCRTDMGFGSNKVLFCATWLRYLPVDIPAAGIDYGVVPFPLRDSEQDSYRSMVSTYGSNCITICSTVKDVDITANIIELISYESMSTLTPALNEWLFEGRGIQHAEDLEMVEIIKNTKTYELCYVWSTGALYSTMISLNNANGEGISSALAGCEDAVKASVQRKLDRLNQLA